MEKKTTTSKKSVKNILTEKNLELKQNLELKDDFANSRFNEKKDLTEIRQKFALELIHIRDKVSTKIHGERIEILDKKYSYTD